MPLIDTAIMLNRAKEDGKCIGAFNIENVDMARGAIEAAEDIGCPIIIQTTYTTVNHAGAIYLSNMVHTLAEQAKVEVSLHLDHGNTFEVCAECIKAGYSSVMIDGSHFPLEKNKETTKSVVDFAKKYNIPVEGEIGKVGGTEDEVSGTICYTNVKECKEFVNYTNIDFVAIGVGTAHGFYDGEPNINIQRIKEIKDIVEVPLVLHGASGLCDKTIQACIKAGISKINFATEIRLAYTKGIREVLLDPKLYDPKVYQLQGRKAVKAIVLEKLKILNLLF